MLQVSGLSKSFGSQLLFSDATFVIGHKERVGLVGRNGHGKSTLFRILLNEESADAGTIGIPKDYRIGHLSQHLHFTGKTALEEASRDLPILEGGWRETHKAEAILQGLGFSSEDLQKEPRLLSGGFQIRLNLARLLASDPDLLLLDEPTNYLDIVSLRWLSRFLRQWPAELILITHDRSFMDSVTTHTIGIHRQKLKKVEGPTSKLYRVIEEEEEIHEKTRQNQLKAREKTEQFIRRFRYKASKARQVQSKIKALEREGSLDELSDIRTLDFNFRHDPFPGKRVFEADSISFRYRKDQPLLIENFDLLVEKEDRIGVIGKNGKGKTTFLNLIAGELTPTRGKRFLSENASLSYFGQTNVERLNRNKTVEEEILSVQPEHNRTAARTICGIMMFEGDLALKKVSVLSGGEKSRVLLGKILATPSNILLLDEPTNHLDMYSCEAFKEALIDYPGAAIFVSHDEELLKEVATKLVIFDRGAVRVFDGSYDQFLEQVGWEDEDSLQRETTENKEKLSKKELRQQRAAEQKKRTELLGPIEDEIETTEGKIEELEELIKDQNQQLIEGTRDGYSDEMAKLSRQIHQNQEEATQLYEALEELLLKLEEATKTLN